MTKVCQLSLVLTFVNSLTFKGDAEPEQPQLSTNQPSQPPQQKPIFYDSSGPLFSLYSEIAKEEDNKMTDLWQQDATDGILVFVRTRIYHSPYYAHQLERYRPVYFQPPSRRSSLCPSRTLGQIHKTHPHSISLTSIRFSLTRTSRHRAHPSLPPLPYHPRSLHRDTPSG